MNVSGQTTADLPSASCALERDEQRWFTEQIHAHEPALKGYLRNSFPAVRDIDDVVQESYLRIWRAKARRQIVTAKAFLFRVARNVALDTVRKARRSPEDALENLRAMDVVAEHDVAAALSGDDKVRVLAEVITLLPEQGRRVLMLCAFEGKTRREAAEILGIASGSVDVHLKRAMDRIEAELRKRGVDGSYGI